MTRRDRLSLRTRLLTDPPLWCWELVDPRRRIVLASSWESFWVAYTSCDDARRAGIRARRSLAKTLHADQPRARSA